MFDDTLGEALGLQLRQSPFLNLVPEQQVQATLRLMGREPMTPITAEVGREVCQRAGAKALLGGTIAMLGSSYVLTLNAQDCVEGKVIAEEQVAGRVEGNRAGGDGHRGVGLPRKARRVARVDPALRREDRRGDHAVARSPQGLQPGPADAPHHRRFRFGAVLPPRDRSRSGIRARLRAARHRLRQSRPGGRVAQDDDARLRASRQGQRGRAALHRGALLTRPRSRTCRRRSIPTRSGSRPIRTITPRSPTRRCCTSSRAIAPRRFASSSSPRRSRPISRLAGPTSARPISRRRSTPTRAA